MPVTTTYPGIYIEEISSSVHTIAAAPTNIAVFVGYTHPFKSQILVYNPATRKTDLVQSQFGRAVQLFSFSDYERNFGGFFSSPIFSPENPTGAPGTSNDFFGNLPYAVNQFFLNGGTVCYVIALQGKPGGVALTPGTVNIGGIKFTAQEITDTDHPMAIVIKPKMNGATSPPTSPKSADITITYGSGAGTVVEVFRQVDLENLADNIGTASSLVAVSLDPGTAYPFVTTTTPVPNIYPSSPPLHPISITND